MKEQIRIACDTGTRGERTWITPVRIFLTADGLVYGAGRLTLESTSATKIRRDLDAIDAALDMEPVSLLKMQQAGLLVGGMRASSGRYDVGRGRL